MITNLSLKTKTFALLFVIVLLATIPLILYYVKTAQGLARLGTDRAVEITLRSAVALQPDSARRETAALSLKKYRQIEALKSSIVKQVVLVSTAYFIAVVIIALIVGYLFISRITRPLTELTGAARGLSMDNLDLRLTSRTGGEIGQLIKAFNTMAEDLSAARQEKLLAERKATWQRVARVIAHEIKNPLTPIKLSTERMYEKFLLHSSDFPAVIKTTTSTILKEIDTLQRLVDTFHKYAKFPDPVLRPASLNAVVEEACALFAGQQVPITRRLDPRVPELRLDKDQIREACTNLLRNAVQAIEEAARAGEIVVTTSREQGAVRLMVADNGCGIAPENIEKLFQPYFTTKKDGNGIGLALTERILSLHGAKIACSSEKDKGTTFTIVFPL